MLTGRKRSTSVKPQRVAVACRCHPLAQREAGNSRVLGLLALIAEDLDTVLERDTSRSSRAEALLHAAWQGLALYRIAHRLYEDGHRVSAALLTWVERIVSGMEVHPGAQLGRRAFIDHGFGVVIGETCVVGDDVSLYHQVTLGSRGWWQEGAAGTRRHPEIGNRVKIGTGASVLGPITIDDDVHIRAHELVLHDMPSGDQAISGMKWSVTHNL
jgi:serine O-acetyltransferase